MTSDAPVDDVERLAAIEAIKQLKACYFRTLDGQDWEGFRSVFTEDARIGPNESGRPDGRTVGPEGRDEFVALVKARLARVTSVHQGHMPEIDVLSSTEARGIWAMEDLLVFPDGSPVARLHGFGHYHETYVRGPEGWKIASTRLTRIRVELDWREVDGSAGIAR
ncbi:nuclear transport factor 2 family protein [Amycolatopsis japonica]